MILFKLLVIVAVVFLASYFGKNHENKRIDEAMYSPDNEEPYPHETGEIIMDYQYMLVDNFIKNKWSKNFLSWECLLRPLSHQFVGKHFILVRHTDGTFHREVIKVSEGYIADGKDEVGIGYKITVVGEEDNENPTPEPKKPEPVNPEPTKPEPNQDDSEKTLAERAQEWLKANINWMNEMIEKSYFTIQVGDGEHDIAKDLLNEVYKAIDNTDLFQLQLKESGIEIYPAPEY